MIQTLIRNWWLLALCGVFEAIYSVMNLFMQGPDGSLTLREFVGVETVRQMGGLALAAGVCTSAAGIWRSGKGRSWLLALNGLAFSGFGLLCIFWDVRVRHSFLPVALLLVVMAVAMGVLAWAIAGTLRRHAPDQWILGLGGAVSIGFGLAFLAMGFRWIRLEPLDYLVCMSAYFGFSAISMLGLGLRLHRLRSVLPAG